jgi:hypothetical protein
MAELVELKVSMLLIVGGIMAELTIAKDVEFPEATSPLRVMTTVARKGRDQRIVAA